MGVHLVLKYFSDQINIKNILNNMKLLLTSGGIANKLFNNATL